MYRELHSHLKSTLTSRRVGERPPSGLMKSTRYWIHPWRGSFSVDKSMDGPWSGGLQPRFPSSSLLFAARTWEVREVRPGVSPFQRSLGSTLELRTFDAGAWISQPPQPVGVCRERLRLYSERD